MAATFCVIETLPEEGFLNMAIDEALSRSFQEEGFRKYAGFIRFYSWKSPWLSCGYFQDPDKILDKDKMKQSGISLVRRLSGGGLVLHDNEITYSIVCFDSILKPHAVKESYFQLTAFVKDALCHLGLDAQFARERQASSSRTSFNNICAYGKEEYDIVVSGRKIGGHAQRRKKSFIFQQGFIPLRPSRYSLVQFLRKKHEEKRSAATLSEFVDVEREGLKDILKEYFRRNLAINLYERQLSAEERKTAAILAENKYSTYGWNYLRQERAS